MQSHNTPRRNTGSTWRSQKPKFQTHSSSTSGINNDDSGIFVTCDKGQEAKCIREMDDLLSEYIASREGNSATESTVESAAESRDIEADIQQELQSMKAPAANQEKLYSFIKLEISCVTFIRTAASLDPVAIVRQLCENASLAGSRPRSRFVKRLTPIVCVRKTFGNGLEQLCETVLTPVFRDNDEGKKFAIRPTSRNNDQLNRDIVIKTVADAVGKMNPNHSVDLKNYDCLILVEVFRNICGMSVVGPEFEKFKRFNLAEINAQNDQDPLKDKAETS